MTSVRSASAAEALPRISVVIPSVMRPALHRAVDSALCQSYPPAEVIVVLDLESVPAGLQLPAHRVRILLTGGKRGPNAARDLGVKAASGDAIALLDDDDYWYPQKLEVQARLLQAARRVGVPAVVSAGVQVVDPAGRKLDLIPRRIIREGQSVGDYLFKRREIRWGEAAMVPSSLLIDRELLQATALDQRLSLHEDWDWLLRAGRDQVVRFVSAPGTLLAYCQQLPGMSLSRGPDWARSMEWADQHRDLLSAREYGDFLLGVTISRALDAGARRAALRVALRAVRCGRPGAPAIVAAVSQLMLPRGAPRVLATCRAAWQIGRARLRGRG